MKKIVSVDLKQICFCSGASKSFESFRKLSCWKVGPPLAQKASSYFNCLHLTTLLIGPFSLLTDLTINLVLNSKQSRRVLRNKRYVTLKFLRFYYRYADFCFLHHIIYLTQNYLPSRQCYLRLELAYSLLQKLCGPFLTKLLTQESFITFYKGMHPACRLCRQRFSVLWGQTPSLLKTGLYTSIWHKISITLPLFCIPRLRRELNIYLQHNYDSSSASPPTSVSSPFSILCKRVRGSVVASGTML